MREAYEAANIYNKLIRTEEEEVLLVKEMSSYILYYNQKILPSLSSQVQGMYILVLYFCLQLPKYIIHMLRNFIGHCSLELDDLLGVHPRGSMLTVTHSMETPQPAILVIYRVAYYLMGTT